MTPVRLCFENKEILSFSYTKEKNYRNRFEFWFFHLILMVHCLFTFYYANKWDLFLKKINGFMLNVTDQYCISPATSKGGFSCHPVDLSWKCHLCHGSCKVTEARHKASFLALQDSQKHFSLPSLPLALFYPREWRVCPHLCWDNILVYLVFPALYAFI